MSKTAIVSGLAAGLLVAVPHGLPGPAAASPPTRFESVNFDLPFGDRSFPDGPNADAINTNCLACHSVEMVLTQPRLPRKAWQAEVEKMRSAYKAPVADADVGAIVDYLVRTQGTE